MRSLIFRTTARFLVALLLLFSVFLLIRGHNDPGGGFVGGLVAAIALILFSMATSVANTRQLLGITPKAIIGIGLLMALISGLPPFLAGEAFLTGYGFVLDIAGITSLKLSTHMLFDAGVYLTVVGVSLAIILALSEE